MTKKLKFLFKFSVVVSVAYALFVLLFLQEVAVFGNKFTRACEEKSVLLPLTNPRVVVDVSDSTLSVLEGEQVLVRYDISTGSNRVPGSVRPDLRSTPLGEYKIVRKAKHESYLFQGSRFLQINYPSPDDIESAWQQGLIMDVEYQRYYTHCENSDIPPQDLAISRQMGIRGNYFAIAGSRSTSGEVAMSNGDINDIYDHLPLGTPVIIRQ